MPHTHTQNQSERNILLALLLNLFFSFAEIIGGYYTNSIAILSDALHDLGDSVTLFVAWRLEKIAGKEQDHKFSYGYKRFSLLGALFSALVLLTGSIFVISEAIKRLRSPRFLNAPGMLVFSLLGILVNGYAAYRMHGEKNMNSKLISWHMI